MKQALIRTKSTKSSKKTMTKNQTMNRDLSFDIRALDDENRSFELSFSSEEPYQRWFGPEVLSHEPGAVDLSRLNEIGVLLYNHNRDKVLGRIDKAWTKDNRAYAQVTFDDDAEADVIFQKVKNKTLRAVSVGYQVESWEEVAPGKTSANGRHVGPCSVALKWQPYEISIVSVPADASVGVGREMEDENEPETFEKGDYSYYERQIQLTKNLLEV